MSVGTATIAGQTRRPGRRQTCYFCKSKITRIDYKDTETLRKFLTEYGRITPRYANGNCAKCQRALARAVKLARFMALLPYVGAVNVED
ncbi:MAG: 30S ribosomal protein S18 [bacterium]|nr:30S ribosomal protein S18 [bacterium]